MPRPYVNVARKSAFTEARSCRISSTCSTPSSANETAPTWIPIVFFPGIGVCAGEHPRAAPDTASVLRNARRSFIWRVILAPLSIYPEALRTKPPFLGRPPILSGWLKSPGKARHERTQSAQRHDQQQRCAQRRHLGQKTDHRWAHQETE